MHVPRKWHAIIPFYMGPNKWVGKHGGAPVDKKFEYLKATVDSMVRTVPGIDINIFVCNPESKDKASLLNRTVTEISCESRRLPYDGVAACAQTLSRSWDSQDIVLFNEDDQGLQMQESVRRDIEAQCEGRYFSPHRWSRYFLFFKSYNRGLNYRFKNRAGIIENISLREAPVDTMRESFTHHWIQQKTRNEAYAACWATSVSTFWATDFLSFQRTNPMCLEAPSYAAFESRYPVYKLDLGIEKTADGFIVDHFSGYDYYRRRVSPLRLLGRFSRSLMSPD